MNDRAIELDPHAREWAQLIEFDPQRHAEERARLGLPTDRPIIMAGHQGCFWHAGIAAKLFAAQSMARCVGGAVAWLVIDTDAAEPTSLRVPEQDAEGRLRDRTGRVDRDSFDHPRAQLAAEAFATHSDEPSAEVRATRATLDLLPGDAPSLVQSSSLAATKPFRALVDWFRTDAAEARSAYNDAVSSQPAAGMRVLEGDAVPFWRVTPHGARLPAREADLEGQLWPRALATTGVVRTSLCDLFIHGTGGRGYEPINDRWLADALGWGLAPYTTATATIRLRFEGGTVTEAQAAQAAWRAHHARHHPGQLRDANTQASRDRLAARIAELPHSDPQRPARFAELHQLLAQYRADHAEELEALSAEARSMRAAANEHSLRSDRTWPAVLHEPSDLEALRAAIDAAFDH